MNNDVNVRFGGDTRGLDQATVRAKAGITSLRPTVTGLQGTLARLSDQVKTSFRMPGIGEAGTALQGLGVNMAGVGMAAESMVIGMATAGGAIVGTCIAIAAAAVLIAPAVVGGLVAFGSKMGDIAEKLDQISQKLAVSASTVSAWGAVVGMAGMSTEKWASAMTKLAKAQVDAANGGKKQSAAFRVLGIDIKNTRDQNELMLQMADRFSKMEDGPRKVALAMATMGRAGAEMIPVLNMGREALEAQMEVARSYGAVMSDELVAAGLRVDDAMDQMGLGMQGLKNTLFEALAPTIEVVVTGLNEMIKGFIQSYREGGTVKTVMDTLVVAIKGVLSVVTTIGSAFEIAFHLAMTVITPVVGTISALGELMISVWGIVANGASRAFSVMHDAAMVVLRPIIATFGVLRTAVSAVSDWIVKNLGGAFSTMYGIAMRVLGPLIRTLKMVGGAMSDAIGGNWAGIASRFTDHMGNVAKDTVGHFNAMKGAGNSWLETQKRIWNGPGAGGPAAPRPRGSGDLEIDGFGSSGGGKKKKGGGNNNAAREALQAQIEEIEFKKEMARDDFEEQMRLEDQKLALLKAFYGANSQDYIRALREKARMQRDHDQEIVQLEQQRVQLSAQIAENLLTTDREVAQERLQIERDRIQFLFSIGRMSDQERVAALAQVTEQEYQIELRFNEAVHALKRKELQDELAIQNLRPPERKRILDQLALLETRHAGEMVRMQAEHERQKAKASQDAAQASVDHWSKVTQPIASALGNAFTQLYNRQVSFRDAMLQVADNIILHWAQKGIQMVADWATSLLAKKAITAATTAAETGLVVAGETAKTVATTVGATTRVAVEVGAAATTKSITIGSVLTEIGAKAANAAAGAYAAIAAIPVVGPFLAPAMAATAFAGVIALGKSIFSASGGWDNVPKDGMITELHKEEMVLPAKFANPLRKSLQGGWEPRQTGGAAVAGAGAGASTRTSMNDNRTIGGPTFNYQPNHTNTNADMSSMLQRDGRVLRKWFVNEVRNGGLSLR